MGYDVCLNGQLKHLYSEHYIHPLQAIRVDELPRWMRELKRYLLGFCHVLCRAETSQISYKNAASYQARQVS